MTTENPDLLVKNYSYELPKELIAQRPASPRDSSRLLIYDESKDLVIHETFKNIADYLPKKTCLIKNNSKVFPCRLKARKQTGGAAEIFLLSLKPDEKGSFSCLIKSSSKKKRGDIFFILSDDDQAIGRMKIEGLIEDGIFSLKPVDFNENSIGQMVYETGKIPIPPYIRNGESDERDIKDYQTLYAGVSEEEVGSVAAPTAGLHFTDTVFEKLKKKEVSRKFVTLHVGLGTFRPVKTESLKEHIMHKENFFVNKGDWEDIIHAPYRVAVGTTSLRVLESLWSQKDEKVWDGMRETEIFLHPGKEVKSIHGLLTNFHLPESTLLMLVSSLIGRKKTLELYRVAVKEKYRFFSYGDAMLILRKGMNS